MKHTDLIKTILLSLSLCLCFVLASSGAMAEEQEQSKKPIVQAMNIMRILHPDQDTVSSGEGHSDSSNGHKIGVVLNDGVAAYMDFGRPQFEKLGPDDPKPANRAIIGFHIPLN